MWMAKSFFPSDRFDKDENNQAGDTLWWKSVLPFVVLNLLPERVNLEHYLKLQNKTKVFGSVGTFKQPLKIASKYIFLILHLFLNTILIILAFILA